MGARTDLKRWIRDVPDFPKPGIVFRDITPLLRDGERFAEVIDRLAERYERRRVDLIAAVEARGLIFGSALAQRLKAGLVPVRKPGKLPAATINATYALEYGQDTLHMHRDGVLAGEHVLIVDDLLATGGTAAAVIELVERLEGRVVELAFVVELAALNGRRRLGHHGVFSLITY